MIKPDGIAHMGKILDAIWQSGLLITKMKMTFLDRAEANEFYREHSASLKFK